MKATLQWNDGRIREVEDHGGIRFIVPWEKDGRFYQTQFKRGPHGSHQLFLEEKTEDITADMRRAEEENRQRTWSYLRRGWDSAGCEVPDCRCACHASQRHGEDK